MSDPLTLKTTNAQGGETIGFRSESENAQRGGFYIGFEETFRGPEELITERQRAYVPLLAGSELVVDLGCGRGEFLDLMAEAGVPARGSLTGRARPLPRTKLTGERLAAALREVVDDPATRDRARAVSRRIQSEDGVGNAVRLIDQHVCALGGRQPAIQ